MAGEDPKHLAYLRTLRCHACRGPGGVAHHSTASQPGMGRRSHDHEAMPMCTPCHTQFHASSGGFKRWNKEANRSWQWAAVATYRPCSVERHRTGEKCPGDAPSSSEPKDAF